ncbi:MAG: SpvB/TcaC N-terminal domain-containing protein, partial [Patescibacteria group bacterium]
MQRFFVARGMVVIGLGIFSLLVSVQDAFATALDRDSSSFVTEQAVTLEPDLRTGSFVYSYPFTLAPGRNGLQPSLSLNYNSANSDVSSIVGYGWSLSVPSIERVNRYGVDDLYTSTTFSSSLSGELEDVSLTDTTHGAYGAKIDDGSFLTYSYGTDETWTVTDKHGMTYVFGAFDDDRLSDPSDTTRVFRWMLSEVRDGNDNVVTYSYQKNGNQIYPLAINYTGNGSAAGIFDVGFSLETRADVAESFAAGFSVETAYRLSGIDVEVNGQARRSYELVYTTGDNGMRSLLQSITETAFDEDAASLTKPATTFDYSTADRSWSEDASFAGLPVTIAGTGNGSLGVYLFDVNGDNLPDVVKARYGGDHAVYINNGDYTWTEDSAYAIPFDFAGPVGQDMGVRVADMDGDGFLDLLYSRTGGGGFAASALYLNNGDGTGWSEDT